jgi:peptidoglycan hydrolase-like protein with peptidoglycan-binding domain
VALFETLFPPVVAFGSRTLRGGETGTDVAVLQTIYNQALRVMNPPLGPLGQPIPVTGTYDAATRQAVRNVEAFFGLAVDGVAGPDVYFAFGQGVGPHVTYGGPPYGSRTLAPGSRGGDVVVLQNRLNVFRYSSLTGGPADGVFGPKTQAAVSAFQADAVTNGDTGLGTGGTVDPATLDATWIYTTMGGRAIQDGRRGFDVVFLQVLLAKLGFYSGRVTGYYDAATRAAVVAFQRSAGIAQDGVVGPQTFWALGQRNQVPAPSPYPLPPIGPAPEVSVCAVPLTSATSDPHPYGAAVHAVNRAAGFESVDVTGNLLPPPASFGTAFGQYAAQLSTSSGVTTILLVQLPGSGSGASDWAGSLSPGVQSLNVHQVTVVPTPAGSTTGPFGPVVLQGDLTPCPSPSAS